MVEGLRSCARLVEGKRIELVVEAVNSSSVPGYYLTDPSLAIGICREAGASAAVGRTRRRSSAKSAAVV